MLRINSVNSIPIHCHYKEKNHISESLLPNSFLPTRNYDLFTFATKTQLSRSHNGEACGRMQIKAVFEAPVLWAGRVCIFYALLKFGLAGSPSNSLYSPVPSDGGGGGGGDGGDLGFFKWVEEFHGKPDKETAERMQLVSKWHPTTKGTLKRNYRIASKSVGRRLLKAIASMLSDDDTFIDATSHKGCQIRRESAHGESVCCNNVRALFDELPTPHLIVEITPFPIGPLTDKDYAKAEKLEKVLRSGPSV